MNEKKKMGPVMTTVIASVLLLLACIIVGVGALANWIPSGGGKLPYGLLASIAIYGNAFIGDFSSKWSFGVLLVDAVVLVLFIVCTVKLIRKKQPKLIYCAFAASLGIAYLPFLGILAYRLMATGHAEVGAMWIIVISFLLDLAGILLMVIASLAAIKAKKEAEAELVVHEEALSEDQIRVIVREEIENYEAAKPVVKTLTKEDVNKIAEDVSNKVAKTVADETVAKALEKHVEDFHAQKEEAPVVEEAVEEPVAEEPAEEEIEAEAPKGENDPFAALRNKRRASFETRLKNADFDLRHKYYDLRDHIKSYGLSNRLSIPGDSFSAHRKRYVFITINGKHLKVYFAANPDDYKDTPIPVERTETKKYEDLPLQFKVRSDLSFRRAVKIVDDMLTKEGYTREDKPVKNTQNPQDK
ncbi:MAG: hypothetical protein MR990_02870 [Mollicutes bacterium]|nr:hypothetical protein [Mollicutes bacterium]